MCYPDACQIKMLPPHCTSTHTAPTHCPPVQMTLGSCFFSPLVVTRAQGTAQNTPICGLAERLPLLFSTTEIHTRNSACSPTCVINEWQETNAANGKYNGKHAHALPQYRSMSQTWRKSLLTLLPSAATCRPKCPVNTPSAQDDRFEDK